MKQPKNWAMGGMFALAMFALAAAGATLDNGMIRREVDLSGGKVRSKSYRATRAEFVRAGSPEFSFLIDGKLYNGLSQWTGAKAVETKGKDGPQTMTVTFREPSGAFEVELVYTVYPNLPVVRKTLAVKNLGARDLKLEGVNVEDFFPRMGVVSSYTLRHYARSKVLGPYVGDWDDPLVMVQDHGSRLAMAIGNETTGVLKRTAVFENASMFGTWGAIRAGVTAPNQTYPFRRWLRPGGSWRSAAVFTAVACGSNDPHVALDAAVDQYVRKYMGVRLEQIQRKPVFVYNTWVPFYKQVNERLIHDVAEAAAECGIEEFVIDDGWQVSNGEWKVNEKKFPHGLKPVFDHIKSLGMKPGLWITLASATRTSGPFKGHPEWFVRDRQGNITSLHDARGSVGATGCLSTSWRDHIRDVILGSVRDHGLAYVKLDLAILTSAYVWDDTHTGCYAKDHPKHKDWQESFDVIYQEVLELFDELHREAPELYIDCTFETAGKLQLMDYGFARHADGNWLSNVGERDGYGSWRIRDLGWWRTPTLPATSLVIGNLKMDDAMHLHHFKSLAGTLPIMLGDPRKLTKAQRAEFKQWGAWLKGLEARHGIMSFRQDLPGFGEPTEGCWDGYSRLNVDTKSGGLVGVFRQNAAERTRTVVLRGLDPVARYAVRRAPDGTTVAEMSGAELASRGFAVTIDDMCGGELFEVIRVAKSANPPKVRIETLKPVASKSGWGDGIRLGSGYDERPVNFCGCRYEGGMAIHANGFATFARDPQWKRVVATVGVDEAHRVWGQSSIGFRIVAERAAGETVLGTSPKISFGGCECWHFDCEIPSDTKNIRFEVDGMGDGVDSDHGHWAECGFL